MKTVTTSKDMSFKKQILVRRKNEREKEGE